MTNGEWIMNLTDVIIGDRSEEGWIEAMINTDWWDAERKRGTSDLIEGINIYCPQCGYKTTIIGTVNKPKWIPCSERLPSEDGRYLVSYWLMKDMPWISMMYYGKPTFPEKDHSCFYVSDGEYGDVEYDDIVAWMPLLEPYRKDEEKGEAE